MKRLGLLLVNSLYIDTSNGNHFFGKVKSYEGRHGMVEMVFDACDVSLSDELTTERGFIFFL